MGNTIDSQNVPEVEPDGDSPAVVVLDVGAGPALADVLVKREETLLLEPLPQVLPKNGE